MWVLIAMSGSSWQKSWSILDSLARLVLYFQVCPIGRLREVWVIEQHGPGIPVHLKELNNNAIGEREGGGVKIDKGDILG